MGQVAQEHLVRVLFKDWLEFREGFLREFALNTGVMSTVVNTTCQLPLVGLVNSHPRFASRHSLDLMVLTATTSTLPEDLLTLHCCYEKILLCTEAHALKVWTVRKH